MARRKKAGVSLVTAALIAGAVFGVNQLAGGDPGTDPAAASSSAPSSPSSPEPPAQTPSQTPDPTPSSTPTSTPTPDEPAALMALGYTGENVRELQHRLLQIDWYAGKITGEYDEVTEEAVQGFQAKRGFDRTGSVDQQTWDRLVEMTRQPTDDEMHNRLTAGPTIIGPGSAEDEVRELQARLKQIGWFNHDVTGTYGAVTTAAVAGFQVKRSFPETGEVDQRTWDKLVEMTSTPTDDELYNRPGDTTAAGLDPRCTTGRALCIDKENNTLRWVVDGSVELTLDVRFGCVGTPTREGAFSVYWKSRDHVSSLYDSEMPFAMFFDGGQAVHYSADFAAVGYSGCSHGCVNVRDYDSIEWLFGQVNVGDKVIVYRP